MVASPTKCSCTLFRIGRYQCGRVKIYISSRVRTVHSERNIWLSGIKVVGIFFNNNTWIESCRLLSVARGNPIDSPPAHPDTVLTTLVHVSNFCDNSVRTLLILWQICSYTKLHCRSNGQIKKGGKTSCCGQEGCIC